MKKADNVLREIEKISDSPSAISKSIDRDYLPIIGKDKGKILEDAVKKYNPKLILEIGTLVGYSSILMARHIKGNITSIEIDKKTSEIAIENIKKSGVSDKVKVINGDALKIIPALGGSFDLVFIDAKKEDYFKYIKAAEPKMTKNAVVIADNAGIFKDKMKDFLEYVRNSGKYKSKTHDFGTDAVEVSTRK